jgi:hypothetical protein
MTDHALNEPVARRRRLQASSRAVIGTLLIREGDGESVLTKKAASTDEIRRLIEAGYRPVGPVGWAALRRGGFLPEGESYLGGRGREEDER